MARIVGPSGMLDIRSVTLLYDIDYEASIKGANSGNCVTPEIQVSDGKFDSSKSWHVLSCVCGLSALSLGILNSTILFQAYNAQNHKLPFGYIIIISGATYAMFILMSPFANCLVKWWGPQFTTTFGLLIGFFGLTVMAFQLHAYIHLAANILLLGPGCAFVQTGACNCISNFFRKDIFKALLLLSISSPLGTLCFIVFSYYIGIEGVLAVKWVLLIYAIAFLASTGIARLLPTTIKVSIHKDILKGSAISEKIKRCLEKNKDPSECCLDMNSPLPWQGPRKEYTWSCMFVADCGVLRDLSCYLWAGICFCVMMTFFIPFICLVPYIKVEFGFGYFNAVRFACAYCGASIFTRIVVMYGHTFTFSSTRAYMQLGLFANASIYFCIYTASTFGWIMAVCLVLGCTEGLFVIIIPRMTFLVFPRKNLSGAWTCAIIFMGIAVFSGTVFLVLGRESSGGDILFPCVVIATFQVIAGLFTFLLPQNGEALLTAPPGISVSPIQTGPIYPKLISNKSFGTSDTCPGTESCFYCRDCPVCSTIGVNPLSPCNEISVPVRTGSDLFVVCK